MSTHNICFRGEIRKYPYFKTEKSILQDLCGTMQTYAVGTH